MHNIYWVITSGTNLANFGTRGLHNIPWARFVTVGTRCFFLVPTVTKRRKAIPTPAPDKTMVHRGGGGFRWTLSIPYIVINEPNKVKSSQVVLRAH